MSSVENVQAVRRLFDAFYAADEAAMSGLIGDDFVTHAPGGGTGNAEGWKAIARKIADASRLKGSDDDRRDDTPVERDDASPFVIAP